MMWYTHTLLGINSLWLLALLPPEADSGKIAALSVCAAFGALLPDLDAAESKVKHLHLSGLKPFELPATLLHQTLGHRGLIHSLLGLTGFSLATIPLSLHLGWQSAVALILGYASHLAADAATRSGIPLLYPRPKRYHLLPRSWRFITGSQAEEVLFAVAAAATLLLLFSHLPFS